MAPTAPGLTLRYLVHSTPLAMLAGTLLGGLAGTLFGLLIVRRRGVYFAMCTIAFGQLWYYLAYSWNGFTGGFDGLARFPARADRVWAVHARYRGGGATFYFFLLAIFAVAVALMGLCCARRSAARLLAIRENERRARFLGIPVERHIWLSFSISCFFTALAGTLYALLNNFADPMTLHYSLSGYFVVMTVIGGMRTFWGPLLGAAVFVDVAGLYLVDDGELDVVHRRDFHARRAVLSARPARHDATAPQGVSAL